MEHIISFISKGSSSHTDKLIETWLNSLLKVDFMYKKEIVKQINYSTYELSGKKDYISVKFNVPRDIAKFEGKTRVPVQMDAYQSSTVRWFIKLGKRITTHRTNRGPYLLSLHIIDGFVDELEIVTADGSLIEMNFSLENVERRIDDTVKK